MRYPLQSSWASLLPQLPFCLSKESTCNAGDLGWEDPLEKGRLPTPVFWPREFYGLHSPWGQKESHMIRQLSFTLSYKCN